MLLLRQFVDDDLGCASYLVGDPDAGVAVVVDPAFAIEQYLEAAASEGVAIERVLETHTHADHVSGHGRLALEQGLPVAIHSLAEAEYPHEPLADGDVVGVGSVSIRVLHTPGHRPEHCAFVVDDELVFRATRCSSATQLVRIWRSLRARERRTSSTRCRSSPRSATASGSIPATLPVLCAAAT